MILMAREGEGTDSADVFADLGLGFQLRGELGRQVKLLEAIPAPSLGRRPAARRRQRAARRPLTPVALRACSIAGVGRATRAGMPQPKLGRVLCTGLVVGDLQLADDRAP